MKKVLTVALLVVLLFALSTTVRAANFSQDLYNYISGDFEVNGQKVKLLTDGQLKQAKDYLDTHAIEDPNVYADIKDNIAATVKIMNEAKVSSVFELEGVDLGVVKSYAKAVAEDLGLTIDYDPANNKIIVTDGEGNVVADISTVAGQVQTDVVNYGYLAIPVVAIIAVAMVAVYKKVEANA